MSQDVILVTGAGGFIGGHLVAHLVKQGHRRIRAVDSRPLADWHQRFDGVENLVLDLRLMDACTQSCEDVLDVYQLAADMGGMGFIENNKAACMLNVLINTHMLMAARDRGVARFFFSSSACVYDTARQSDTATAPLKESDAYPAMPEDGYGWEKLFSERMCRHFTEDFGLQTRVARFHNVYGPNGPWDGGREKAPAAICRKVLEAKEHGRHEIEVWGSGQQTRSFMYIDDCIRGIELIMNSTRVEPINLGSSEVVSIDGLVEMVESIACVTLERKYAPLMPQGVRGRSSDNTEILATFGWEPRTPLVEGLVRLYQWIAEQYAKRFE
jgi:nucleoside-diphosphate-sugar epimerase